MADHYLKAELYERIATDPRIFDFLQAGSLDGVWYWDLEDPAQEWMSPRFWETLGWDPAEREHKSAEWQDLIHPDDLQGALREYELCLETPGRLYNCPSVRYRGPDGEWTWVRCRGFLIRDEAGKPIRLLGAHNEITELKRTQLELERKVAELEAAKVELERSNEALAQFAYIASHDLQEPLRMVSGFTALLARRYGGQLDEKAEGWMGYITDGAARMSEMIQGLLDWSRVQTHGGAMKSADLGTIVDQARTDLGVAIAEAEADIRVEGALPTVQGDPAQLRRVFQNLIGNAVKFRAPDRAPVVTLCAERSGDRWLVRIADNGIGIDPKHHGRILEMFQRLHTRTEYEGSGLGLAICQRILHRHEGELEVESAGEGQGSTFVVTLPAR